MPEPQFTTEQMKEIESYLVETREYWLLKKRSATVLAVAVGVIFVAFGVTTWQAAALGARSALVEPGVQAAIDQIKKAAEDLEEDTAVARLKAVEQQIESVEFGDAEALMLVWYLTQALKYQLDGDEPSANQRIRQAYLYMHRRHARLPQQAKHAANEAVKTGSLP